MNIIVFDTETIGKKSQDLLNVGYIIADLNPTNGEVKTLVARDYLVTDLFANTVYMLNDDFVGGDKYAIYCKLIEEKKIVKHSIATIFKLMAKDIATYKPLFGYAYNCSFDIDKFTKTANALNIPNPLDKLPIHDIWAYALQHIVHTDDYKAWALANEQFSKSEIYLSGSAETVSRYIYENLDFAEQHTALSDCGCEIDILCECVKCGCDITKPIKRLANLKSDKEFTDIIVTDNEEIEIKYKSKYTKGNKIFYKN